MDVVAFIDEARALTNKALEGIPIFVATAEDVILSKLEWAKMGESLRQAVLLDRRALGDFTERGWRTSVHRQR